MRIIFVAISFYMILSQSARAADSTTSLSQPSSPTNTVKAKTPKAKSADKAFSLGLELSYDNNMADQESADFQAHSTTSLSPQYKINKHLTTGALVGLEKELSGQETLDFTNTSIYLSASPKNIAKSTTLGGGVNGLLPTNEKDRTENSFNGAAGASLTLAQKYSILKKSGSAAYTTSYLQNFHTYERNNLDSANLQHRVRHAIKINQDLSKLLAVELLGRYQVGYTYQNALRTSFLIYQELQININATTQLFINHANAGDARDRDGEGSNVDLYNKYDSTITTGLRASF